jgi:hypothetical protein
MRIYESPIFHGKISEDSQAAKVPVNNPNLSNEKCHCII